MMLKALIVEQLEEDGTLRTLTMQPSAEGFDLVVAFADEYDEMRSGPFHFLSHTDEHRYRDGFAKCRARQIGSGHFYRKGESFHVETSWTGIRTERNRLSYYALSLPEFSIPHRLSVADPHTSREYRRSVTRDDKRNRYVIYLQCTSSYGQFDFRLSCDFVLDPTGFASSTYEDTKTQEYGDLGTDWEHWLPDVERTKVQQFFLDKVHIGDSRSADQAGAVGPEAQARDMTFYQFRNQDPANLDLPVLQDELSRLRHKMRQESSRPEHDIAIGEVAAAETAAQNGDESGVLEHLKKAGSWAYDVATKIGEKLAVAAIKKALEP